MMLMMQGMFVLSIIFCVVVAPIWIVAHYFSRGRRSAPGLQEDKQKIEQLLKMADTMESRLVTLEAILDKQHPNWRHEI